MTTKRLGAWISPPGETMEDLLEEKGWTKAEFARRLGCSTKHVSQLLSGKVPLTDDLAMALASVLGGTAAFWLEREARYREGLKLQETYDRLEAEADLLDELPMTWLVKEGCVKRYRHRGQQLGEVLRFFGVASVDSYRECYANPGAVFRASAVFGKDAGAVAAWIRRSELAAEQVRTAPWNEPGFRRCLRELRSLTAEPDPKVFIPKLTQACAEQGVAVVFVRTPPKCPASGMTLWRKGKAILVLSLRYKSNDQLWFTFFHEAGHLLLHGRKMVFIEGLDGLDPEKEREADEFARDFLIPPEYTDELESLRSEPGIRRFATKIGIHPGIVVGRLQKEGILSWKALNDLKQRYDWGDDGSVVARPCAGS